MADRTTEEQELFTQVGMIPQGSSEGALSLTPELIDGVERRCRQAMQSNPEHIELARAAQSYATTRLSVCC